MRSDFGDFSLGDELRQYYGDPQRTLVFGAGDVAALAKNPHLVGLGGNSAGFMGVAMSGGGTPLPPGAGFTYASEIPLTFDSAFDGLIASSNAAVHPGRLSGASIIRVDRVAADYGVNGIGVYLKTSEGKIPVYNTLYPFFGTPLLDGTASPLLALQEGYSSAQQRPGPSQKEDPANLK